MTLSILGQDALRGLVVLVLCAIAMVALRRSSASIRRLVLVGTFVGLAVLPLSSRAAGLLGFRGEVPSAAVKAFAEPLADAPAGLETPAGATPSEGGAVATQPATLPISWRSLIAAGIPTLWLLGAVVVLARAVMARVSILRIVGRARPAGGRSASALADASERIGASARVLISDEVDVPAVSGVLRPVILVPPTARDWSEETWRHVLLHELAHVRHADTLGLALSQIGCAMHWYNPLSWWARRRLEAERELAADEVVLTAGALPSSYARTLLDVAVASARPGAFGAGSVAAARGGVGQRIETIVSGIAKRPPSLLVARLLVVAAVGSGLGPGCVGAGREAEGVTPEQRRAVQAPLAERVADVVGTKPNEIELTIDPKVQRIAEGALEELRQKWKPRDATAIVIDPVSGQVLALAGADLAKRNIAPGSIFKLVTVAAAIERNAVTPEMRFDCGSGSRAYGARTLTDAGSYGALSVREIVATSSNVGASRIFDALGGSELGYWLERTGFDDTSPIELSDLARPAVPRKIEADTIEGAQLAIGHQMPVSLLHLGAFYAAIANGGQLPQLTLVRSIGGHPRMPAQPSRILSDNTAKVLREMLDGAVNDQRATGKGAQVAGIKVGGKTGTSGETPEDTLTSFIGIAPIDNPKYVVVVSALGPRGDATGGRVAAPTFGRIVAQLLGRR